MQVCGRTEQRLFRVVSTHSGDLDGYSGAGIASEHQSQRVALARFQYNGASEGQTWVRVRVGLLGLGFRVGLLGLGFRIYPPKSIHPPGTRSPE